jgi:hypothetical protein
MASRSSALPDVATRLGRLTNVVRARADIIKGAIQTA